MGISEGKITLYTAAAGEDQRLVILITADAKGLQS
jgi:hypothetical protein